MKTANKKRCGFATQGYAAPEQYEDAIPDVRADIYGIGKLLQFMLTNSKGYDKRLNSIVARCTKQRPAERYKSVIELKSALEMLLPGEGKQKDRKKSHRFTPVLLGVASVENTEDSFMVSVLFANYFSELTGKRVALLDLSGSYKLKKMQEVFLDCREQRGEVCGFLLHGVSYYDEARVEQIGLYLAEGFDILVLHFGQRAGKHLAEFLRCEEAYVVGSAMPWQLSAWEELESLFRTGAKKQVTALLTAGQTEEISVGVWKKAVRLPAVKDVFLPRGELARFLQHLLLAK